MQATNSEFDTSTAKISLSYGVDVTPSRDGFHFRPSQKIMCNYNIKGLAILIGLPEGGAASSNGCRKVGLLLATAAGGWGYSSTGCRRVGLLQQL